MKKRSKKSKKWYYKFITECLTVILLISVTGCGKNSTSAGQDKLPKIPIKIEDIAWSMNDEIIDGDRCVAFSYTNNTNKVITYFKMEFTVKDKMTENEKSILEEVKEKYDVSDEELSYASLSEEIEEILKPGEKSKKEECYDFESANEFKIMQPDIATIEYVDKDNKIYKIYYDYKNKSYSRDSAAPKDLVEWEDNELTKLLPSPKFYRTEILSNSNKDFYFKAFAVTSEQGNSYIEECKSKGFTIDADFYSSDDYISYDAKNRDGYKVSVDFYIDDKELSVDIDAP